MQDSQTCNKCKEVKPLADFTPNKTKPRGRMYTCKVCHAERARERRRTIGLSEEQKQKARNRSALWRKQNPDRSSFQKKDWAQRNPHKKRESSRRYYMSRDKRMPSWLTEEHKRQIQDFYWMALDLRAITGEEYHVDHIVPLKGENVSGLHVPWNLQILPKDVNLSKGNKHGAD